MSTTQRTAMWQRLAGDREFIQFLQEQRDDTYKSLMAAKDENVWRSQGKAIFIEDMVRSLNTARGS